jgi:hypothetical protein
VETKCRTEICLVIRSRQYLARRGPHNADGGLRVVNPVKGSAIFNACPPSSSRGWNKSWQHAATLIFASLRSRLRSTDNPLSNIAEGLRVFDLSSRLPLETTVKPLTTSLIVYPSDRSSRTMCDAERMQSTTQGLRGRTSRSSSMCTSRGKQTPTNDRLIEDSSLVWTRERRSGSISKQMLLELAE